MEKSNWLLLKITLLNIGENIFCRLYVTLTRNNSAIIFVTLEFRNMEALSFKKLKKRLNKHFWNYLHLNPLKSRTIMIWKENCKNNNSQIKIKIKVKMLKIIIKMLIITTIIVLLKIIFNHNKKKTIIKLIWMIIIIVVGDVFKVMVWLS